MTYLEKVYNLRKNSLKEETWLMVYMLFQIKV